MDKKIGSILFVFLSLLHLSHCQQTLYKHTDYCTKITVKITADIVYPQKNNGKETAKVDGSDFSEEDPLFDCEDGRASLNIEWMNGSYSLTLDFTEHNNTWELSSIQFEYFTSDPVFHNPKFDGDTLKTDATEITDIELGNSYSCMNGVTYHLTSQHSTVQLTLTDLQVQVFNFTKPKEFGKAKDCPVPPPMIYFNASCICVVMRINNITITYQNTSAAGNKTEVEAMIQSNNYSVIYDNCQNLAKQGNSKHAKITIGWPFELNYYNLSITFSANYKKGQQGWEIGGMTFGYNNPALNKTSALLSFSKDFTDDDIALTRSYKCDQADHYDFKSGSPSSTATIWLSFIQMQAFQFSDPNSQAFGSAVECDQAATSVLVPILVGAALGLFVVILLLAYVVGRVRQQRAKSGYHRL